MCQIGRLAAKSGFAAVSTALRRTVGAIIDSTRELSQWVSLSQDCVVTTASTFVGKSGANYSFADIELAWLQPRTAGNYLYLRQEGEMWIVLFVGNCDDLLIKARERWSEAVSQHDASHIQVRRIVTSRVRQEERADILLAYKPAMNLEVILTHEVDVCLIDSHDAGN
jgi:hypothetical protein